MLSADHMKKHIYEYRGIDVQAIPDRCSEIVLETAKNLFSQGYKYFDLSLFCVLYKDKVVEWNIRSANQGRNISKMFKGSTVEITRNVIMYLPYGGTDD